MAWKLVRTLVILAALSLVQPVVGHACGSHGTQAGSNLQAWLSSGVNEAGEFEAFVAIEDDFIIPTSTTVCVCGIGLGTTAEPLPRAVQVVGAHVSVLNVVSGDRAHLTAFEFVADPDTQAGLEVGDSGDPATLPIFAGATWFGFSASVEPFDPVVLAPGEILVLGFDLTLPPEELPLLSTAQFAAGEGNALGEPIFSGSHRVEYFTATDPAFALPEPSQSLGLVLGALALTALRTRR